MTSNKKIITSAVFASLVLSGCNVSSFDSATDANKEEGVQAELPVINVPKNAENRYVVVYNDAAKDTNSVLRDTGEFSTRRAERTLSTFNINVNSIIEHLPSNNASVVTLSDDQLAELQAMTNIATSPIALVEPDVKRKLIEPFLDNSPLLAAETSPYGIAMVQADQVSDQYAGNQTLCIIDSGYDLAHDDLQKSGVTGGNTAPSAGEWNIDNNSHGTHVAGTIAALGGNGIGVRGVHQSGNLNLHIVKVFTADGWAWGSDLVKAIAQCRDNGAKVVSMSLGGGGASNYERNAMNDFYANGMLLIAAAGNDGNSSLSYPASYDSVMSVAAVDRNRNRASFSQYNAQVEISGPGVAVKSTVPNNGYASYSGTSMATPHVSAVASLVWSYAPNCSAAELRDAMINSAQDLGSAGRDQSYGYGLVQALAMKTNLESRSCASGGTGPTDPTDPTDPSIVDLSNGVAVSQLSGQASATLPTIAYRLNVPTNATDLVISISGGSGDADLYVRHGSEPEFKTFTCRPYNWGNNETCTISKPDSGDWYIMLHAYSNFAGVSLKASYQEPVSQTERILFESLQGKKGDMLLDQDGNAFVVTVDDTMKKVTFTLSGGSGDADLYLRQGAAPTRRIADCKPFVDGNEEVCTLEGTDLTAGDWFVGVQAFEDFSDVDLFIDIENK
jgi:serine protease